MKLTLSQLYAADASLAVNVGSAAGTAGTGTNAGGAGGSGMIIVDEIYT